jgi:hypothetical protein
MTDAPFAPDDDPYMVAMRIRPPQSMADPGLIQQAQQGVQDFSDRSGITDWGRGLASNPALALALGLTVGKPGPIAQRGSQAWDNAAARVLDRKYPDARTVGPASDTLLARSILDQDTGKGPGVQLAAYPSDRTFFGERLRPDAYQYGTPRYGRPRDPQEIANSTGDRPISQAEQQYLNSLMAQQQRRDLRAVSPFDEAP